MLEIMKKSKFVEAFINILRPRKIFWASFALLYSPDICPLIKSLCSKRLRIILVCITRAPRLLPVALGQLICTTQLVNCARRSAESNWSCKRILKNSSRLGDPSWTDPSSSAIPSGTDPSCNRFKKKLKNALNLSFLSALISLTALSRAWPVSLNTCAVLPNFSLSLGTHASIESPACPTLEGRIDNDSFRTQFKQRLDFF